MRAWARPDHPPIADRGPAEAPAAGRGTGSGEGERSSTTWSADKTPDDAPAAEGRPGAWTAGAEPPAGERRGGDTWASGAATGDIRPANAWATGAAAASNAVGAAGAAERRPSDARGAEPGDHPNGTSAGTASRPGTDEGGRPDTSAAEPPARDDQAAGTTFGGSGHDLFEPSRGGGQQVPSQQAGSAFEEETEPPEETADPALGRVAATVEDEVLVVDEQPRYHLVGCRALVAQHDDPAARPRGRRARLHPVRLVHTPIAALGARHPASARP